MAAMVIPIVSVNVINGSPLVQMVPLVAIGFGW
jgi:hypothetical protein